MTGKTKEVRKGQVGRGWGRGASARGRSIPSFRTDAKLFYPAAASQSALSMPT